MAIDELSLFFHSVQLPETLHISHGVKIINLPDFIEGHLKVLNKSVNEPSISVFYERLIMIKNILTSM